MTNLRLALVGVMLLLSGCAQGRGIDIDITYNNLSDSYVYPYRIAINGTANTLAQLLGCSNGTGTGALVMKTIPNPPRFIVVEWEHLVTRKVYRARVELSDAAGPWWRKTPFRDADGNPESRRPTLVIQWRGPKKVAAMLVADNMDFARASLDLGEAEGKEIPRPDWGPKLYLGYSEFRRKPWTTYQPGAVSQYRRSDDDTLPPEQRFGYPACPTAGWTPAACRRRSCLIWSGRMANTSPAGNISAPTRPTSSGNCAASAGASTRRTAYRPRPNSAMLPIPNRQDEPVARMKAREHFFGDAMRRNGPGFRIPEGLSG